MFAAVALATSGSYDYSNGGRNWASVTYSDGTVNECGTGLHQSPIDLVDAELNGNLKIFH